MKKSSKGRMKQKIYSQNISLSRTQMTNNHPIGLKKKFSGNRSFREEFIQKMSYFIELEKWNEKKWKTRFLLFHFSVLSTFNTYNTHNIYCCSSLSKWNKALRNNKDKYFFTPFVHTSDVHATIHALLFKCWVRVCNKMINSVRKKEKRIFFSAVVWNENTLWGRKRYNRWKRIYFFRLFLTIPRASEKGSENYNEITLSFLFLFLLFFLKRETQLPMLFWANKDLSISEKKKRNRKICRRAWTR